MTYDVVLARNNGSAIANFRIYGHPMDGRLKRACSRVSGCGPQLAGKTQGVDYVKATEISELGRGATPDASAEKIPIGQPGLSPGLSSR
jgi:hypothetical protein